jgi:hypothetical protein
MAFGGFVFRLPKSNQIASNPHLGKVWDYDNDPQSGMLDV